MFEGLDWRRSITEGMDPPDEGSYKYKIKRDFLWVFSFVRVFMTFLCGLMLFGGGILSMCAFGVEVGILRRLHCYPLCVVKSEDQNYGRCAPLQEQQGARESFSSIAGAPPPPERRPEHSTEMVS